jgi:hypothetical protein
MRRSALELDEQEFLKSWRIWLPRLRLMLVYSGEKAKTLLQHRLDLSSQSVCDFISLPNSDTPESFIFGSALDQQNYSSAVLSRFQVIPTEGRNLFRWYYAT